MLLASAKGSRLLALKQSRIVRRRKQIPFLFLLAGVSACDYLPWDRFADQKDPVATTRGFLAAARRGDCEKAWTYFSPETQAKIREQSKRMVRGAPYYSDVFAPTRIHCTPYDSYRPSTVRLASQQQERATVEVMARVPDPKSFSLPGWTPIGRMDEKRTIDLTHESDDWKILPHVPEDPRAKYGEITYDIGRAVIVTRPGKLVDGMTKFLVQGDSRMDVTPADLERVMADPTRWPRFWPLVSSARWLGKADPLGYRPLSIVLALPDGPREARIFFRQAGRTAQGKAFSFGFGSEYSHSRESEGKAKGSGRLSWAGTFSARPDHRGGSTVHWSQSVADSLLAHQDMVASQLQAFEREAQ
jgi:hypothetical protein